MVKHFQKAGWVLSRVHGSHHIMKRADGSTVVIPVHRNQSLHIGIQNKLLETLEGPPEGKEEVHDQ